MSEAVFNLLVIGTIAAAVLIPGVDEDSDRQGTAIAIAGSGLIVLLLWIL